jgi:metal-sulfur cluster biosynthetic enzyme
MPDGPALSVAQAWAALRDVRDPEWPVSIVDLGLVREVAVEGGAVTVRLTFTSTACPCIDWIRDDVRERLLREPGVTEVRTEVVWDEWSPGKMSAAARRQFLAWGVSL